MEPQQALKFIFAFDDRCQPIGASITQKPATVNANIIANPLDAPKETIRPTSREFSTSM